MQIDTSSSQPNDNETVQEFKIPIRKEQLRDQPTDNKFWVQDFLHNVGQWPEDRILGDLQNLGERICGTSKCTQIISNDNFDFIYSLMCHLEDVPLGVRKEIMLMLNQGLRHCLKALEKKKLLNQDYAFDHRKSIHSGVSMTGKTAEIPIFRNCLKAYVYLLSWFLQEYGKLKETKDLQTKHKKKPAKGGRSASGDQQSGHTTEIKQQTLVSLDLFNDIMEAEIQFLWSEQKVEEEFVKIFVKTGFDMLESPSNTKTQEIKEKLFSLMQKCMERFGPEIKYMQSQNSTKIIDLLYNQDGLAPPLAEFVALVSVKQGNQMPNEIIRDLTKQIFHNDSSYETIGIKNVAIFLKKLSKRAPKVVYQNISSILGFFDCEAYQLRQSLIKILCNLIQHVLASTDNSDIHTQQVYYQTKEKFLELLIKRFLDKSSFCRSQVIKVFLKLTEKNVVPRNKYYDILCCVVGRLRDQTMNVRKNALRLYQQLIMIHAIIFGVDLKDGKGFMSIESINHDIVTAQKDLLSIEKEIETVAKKVEHLKRRISQENQVRDQTQLQALLEDNQDYLALTQEHGTCQRLYDDNKMVIESRSEYGQFITKLDESISTLTQLLSSKTIQDTIETIKVFRVLHSYGVEKSFCGIRKMLTLVFSKENSIQTAIFECYQSIYFNSMKHSVQEQTRNLLTLMEEATLTDITCIEELIKRCVAENVFSGEVFNSLWRYYVSPDQSWKSQKIQEASNKVRAKSKQEQRDAMQLLRMIGSSKIEVLMQQKENLFQSSLKFAQQDCPDFVILKESLLAYEKVILHQMSKQKEAATVSDADKKHLFSLVNVAIKHFGTQDLEWFCATETILNTLFNIKARNSPEYAKYFINQMIKKMYSSNPVSQQVDLIDDEAGLADENNDDYLSALRNDITDMHYAQLFFVIGHISIKMLTYIEQVDNELKKAGNDNQTNQNKSVHEQSGRHGKNPRAGEESKQDEELDQIAGGKEAEIEQYSLMLTEITEKFLIQNGLLGKFFTPILEVSRLACSKYSSPLLANRAPPICILERSAILALCKVMCVSSVICQENIDLLFSLLRSGIDFGIKANIIISVGDLYNRFPNILNEKTKDIFMLLHDSSNHVRRQALMVITHLILNDMLKLKGEIVDICKLLQDEDEKIKDQVKLFLHELHSKGNNIIYNLFPKAISRLSKEFAELPIEEFEDIAKQLLEYINKDQQTLLIVDKLCLKMKNSSNPIEWRNTAFCLSQIKYTEKIFQKLVENYEHYKERLFFSNDVKAYFTQIMQQLKKLTKPEVRQQVDDFENKISIDEVQLQQEKANTSLNARPQNNIADVEMAEEEQQIPTTNKKRRLQEMQSTNQPPPSSNRQSQTSYQQYQQKLMERRGTSQSQANIDEDGDQILLMDSESE